ncbi:MAG: NAD(P) transhydrogenase subunit alpha [Myxococcota bacterium]
MIIAVPREVAAGERRIALVPEAVKRLVDRGFEVRVETAGDSSDFPDADFEAAGASLVTDVGELYESADVVVKVRAPMEHPKTGKHEADMLREGSCLIAVLQPHTSPELVERLATRRVTSFALDLMPRTALAQDKDVLSSMSTIAGYKAVLLAASDLPKLMPMLMTAAGTIKPARVLVIGVGVAGLQAIATARRLGAVVEAFDVRPAVKEQVESLGARFVAEEGIAEDAEQASGYAREQTEAEQQQQRELLSMHIAGSDVVICSALVPGRRAPVLLSSKQVEGMRPGSVVIDLAADQGGNCELTVPGQVVVHCGVRIHGPENVASSVPVHASQMFARNVQNYLLHLTRDGTLELDLDDELTRGPLVTCDGKIVHEGVRAALEA